MALETTVRTRDGEGFDMTMCDLHWFLLRSQLDEAGLTEFVSKSGAEVVLRLMEGDREGDPLIGAHNAILQNALRRNGGPFAGCPLCRAPALGVKAKDWVARAVHDECELGPWLKASLGSN